MILKPGKTFTLKKMAIISLISVTMLYAFTEHHFGFLENEPQTSLNCSYNTLSTAQLQIEVERHSINGDLPFEMGLELIKRWTNK